MPTYTYARPSDGLKIRVRGDSPPSKEQLDALFRQADERPPEAAAQAPEPTPAPTPGLPPLPESTWASGAPPIGQASRLRQLGGGVFRVTSEGLTPSEDVIFSEREAAEALGLKNIPKSPSEKDWEETFKRVREETEDIQMMPGRVGFDVARQYPGTVVTEEDVRQAQQAPPRLRWHSSAAQEPTFVAPTAEEAAAIVAAAPALAAGAMDQAGMSILEAPAVVAREAGVPPLLGLGHVWERRDEEAELFAQEEARLQEALGKEWSEAISEDAEAIASMGEVLGHAVNKAMEEAKEKGEDPIKAVADLGFEGGEKMVKAFDRDLRLLAANPTEYPRAYPLTTFFLALPAMPAAAAGAKGGTVSLLNMAKQSPGISRMMEKSGDLLVKAHKEFSLRRAARRHGLTPEELRQAEKAVAEAPPRPGPKAAPPPPTEPPAAAPRAHPEGDLTSLQYREVEKALKAKGADPLDTGPAIPDAEHFAGLTAEGKLTGEAVDLWQGIEKRWLDGELGSITPREKAVITVIHRDATTKAEAALNMSDDIIAGKLPEYPVGSEAARSKLIELNQAFSASENTWYDAIAMNTSTVSDAARVLRLQQYFMDEAFGLLHMKRVAELKKGKPLTPKEADNLAALSRKAKEAQGKLDGLTDELNALRKEIGGLSGKEAAVLDRKMEGVVNKMFDQSRDLAKATEGWAALKHSLEKGTVWGAIGDLTTMLVHGPKMMRAIWDASGATVQAGLSGLGHPVLMGKALAKYIPGAGQAWTERGAFTSAISLMDDPATRIFLKARGPIYDMGGASGPIMGVTAGDDMFAQGILTHIVNRHPAMGAWVKPSTRVHAAFLNSYRVSLFKNLMGLDLPPVGQMNPMQKLVNPFRRNYYSKVTDIQKKMDGATGKRLEALKLELKQAKQEADQFANVMARYVGAATGHGTWAGGQEGVLNAFFWSKRMFTSAFEHPTRTAVWTYKDLRKIGKDLGWADDAAHNVAKRGQIAAAADAARSAVGMGALLGGLEQAGWEVVTNPFSPDFGRARKGDQVIDLGGFQMVLMRAITATMSGEKAWLQIGRFMRKKANPGLSALLDLYEGEDYMGAPVDVATTLGNLAVPLSAENFLKAMHSGEMMDSPYYSTAKMLGGKTWMEGDERAGLSEIFPYKHIPYAGEIDMQLELPEWITEPERFD